VLKISKGENGIQMSKCTLKSIETQAKLLVKRGRDHFYFSVDPPGFWGYRRSTEKSDNYSQEEEKCSVILSR